MGAIEIRACAVATDLNNMIGIELSAWTTAFAPSLLSNPPRVFNFSLVAVSGYGHHHVTGDFGLLPQAHVGFHCALAGIGVVCFHPGLGKTRGEARRQITWRRHGEDADPVPHLKHRRHSEVRFARGARTTARLFGQVDLFRGALGAQVALTAASCAAVAAFEAAPPSAAA